MVRSPKILRLSPWLYIIVLAISFTTSACNTMKGFGEDLSKLGDKITGSAEKHTDK